MAGGDGDAGALGRVAGLFACVATDPRIGPVLCVDLDPALLPPLAEHLSSLIHRLRPRQPAPDVHPLGSWTDGDDLWRRLRSAPDGRLEFAPGPLAEQPGRPAPILTITQLGAVGLGVLRALLTETADPRVHWLAAASRDELAVMSPHLLDRFVARVDGRELAEQLATAATEQGIDTRAYLIRALAQFPLPGRGITPTPTWTDEASDQIIRTLPPSVSRRQDLALSRTARAIASASGATTVQSEHVLGATVFLGLYAISPPPPPDPEPSPPPDPTPSPAPTPTPVPTAPPPPERPKTASTRRTGPARPEQVAAPGARDEFAPAFGDVSRAQTLYPELQPDALPVPGSLRAPRRGKGSGHGPRGPIVGVKPVDSPAGLRDIALCATVIQAGLFRAARERVRQQNPEIAGDGAGFIHARDLRQFLRRAQNKHILILVIDHTCLPGWRWQSLLGPQLNWAYRESAAVSVIEFGHRDTTDELAAHALRARNLVDPRIARSVAGREPGRASPLAHALDLTARQLRRAVAAAAPDDEIRLVVLTDGRGNVPLNASVRGRPPKPPVFREGVEDALRAAAVLRGLGRTRVRRWLLGPQPHQYPGLLYDLADALDAELHLGPLEDAGPPEDAGPQEVRPWPN